MHQLRADLLKRLSLAQRFMFASLIILVSGMLGIGWWVGRRIEVGVVHRTAATTALYVDSMITPHVQELAEAQTISPGQTQMLSRLLQDTSLGQQIVVLKIWDANGRIVYSTDPANIGRVFPVEDDLAQAWRGWVAAEISDLSGAENERERQSQPQLLEMYSPVRLSGTDRIIAVAEFYQTVDDLQREISAAQQRSWLVVGAATLVMYLLLAGFVQRASNLIDRQQVALSDQVTRLTELLAQNEKLHERVRRAAVRTTALNERFLRRISAELHDGPVQDLSLALLSLDRLAVPAVQPDAAPVEAVETLEGVLRHALQEIRAISAGLGLPQLNDLTLTETITRVVRTHERRTGTSVAVTLTDLPTQATLPVKITVYRLIQEALTNAYRHADGSDQALQVACQSDWLSIVVADSGPGFDTGQTLDWEQHLGLVGMRERVESLGGVFQIESERGGGTRVVARLSLQAAESEYER